MRRRATFWLCGMAALFLSTWALPPGAMAQPPGGQAGPGPRRGGPPRREMPKPGPVPLPILPALAADGDTSFYAQADVPHGKVVQATYTNQAGKDKRMHVYLPPDYEKDPDAKYPRALPEPRRRGR